jgi:hypothetical protein
VIGAATGSITNTQFQLDGNDLFALGNIGSASSVYTNGSFVAGSNTYLGSGSLSNNGGDLYLSSSADVVIQSNGNKTGVGGITAPEAIFQIGPGTAGGNMTSASLGVNVSNGQLYSVFRDTANAVEADILVGNFGGVSAGFGTATNHPLSLFVNNGSGILIAANENVGIGPAYTPAILPSEKLEVVGTASATRMSSGTTLPHRNNLYDLGSATRSWANIYSSGTGSVLRGLSFTNATGTNVTATNLYVDTITFTNATGSNLSLVQNLSAVSTTLQNLNFSYATAARIFATDGVFTNLTLSNFTPINLGWTNATGTNTTSTNLFATYFTWNGATGTNIFATNGSYTNETVTYSTATNLSVATYARLPTDTRINNTLVCLADGTNCPTSITGAGTGWLDNAASDLLRTTTSTRSLVIGATASATAPFYFQVASPTSSLQIGRVGNANLIVGTSTYGGGLNSMFALNGDDVIIQGSLGSVSSVFTNGALVVGNGGSSVPTLYGNGFISAGNGLVVTSSAAVALTVQGAVSSTAVTTTGLAIKSALSCKTVGTDANGNVACGAPEVWSASSSATTTLSFNVPMATISVTTTPSNTNIEMWVTSIVNVTSSSATNLEVDMTLRRSTNGFTCTSTAMVGDQQQIVLDNAYDRFVMAQSYVDAPATVSPISYNQCLSFTPTAASGKPAAMWRSITVMEVNLTVSGADLAEVYYSDDSTIAPGEIVSLANDRATGSGVKRSQGVYDKNVIGVVSTQPGLVVSAREGGGTPIMVALAGRVPVKVSDENGPIEVGDMLTPSSIPGVAMKVTKAGPIVGKALSSYNGTGPAKVIMFVQSGQYTGSDLVQPDVTGGEAMSWLLNQRLATATSTVDLLTRRVMAESEVLAPRVTTNELTLDAINVLNQQGALTMNLGNDNSFVIRNASSTEGVLMSVDSLGNAFFAGTVTAQKIAAGEIVDFDTLLTQALASSTFASPLTAADVISELATSTVQIAQLSTSGLLVQGDALVSGSVSTTRLVAEDLQSPVLDALFGRVSSLETGAASFASSTSDLTARVEAIESLNLADLFNATSSLVMENQPMILQGGLMVDSIGSLGDQIAFMNDTVFIGRPYFNADMGGSAVVSAGHRAVDVVFDQEYLAQPIVNASIALDERTDAEREADPTYVDGQREDAVFAENIQYLITKKSTKGFTILLRSRAETDIPFNWTALAIKDANIFFSTSTSFWNAESTTSSSPVIEAPVETSSDGGSGTPAIQTVEPSAGATTDASSTPADASTTDTTTDASVVEAPVDTAVDAPVDAATGGEAVTQDPAPAPTEPAPTSESSTVTEPAPTTETSAPTEPAPAPAPVETPSEPAPSAPSDGGSSG